MPPQHSGTGTTMSPGRPPSPSTPITGGRPQFRRQGSSYGPGHVHHMAVMVAPTRVDYSVNKGGLRSWVVLIVFVLLCSAIFNIFSKEGEGNDGTEENELTHAEDSLDIEKDTGQWGRGEDGTKAGSGLKKPIISAQEEDDEEEEEDDEDEEEDEEENAGKDDEDEKDEANEEEGEEEEEEEEEDKLEREKHRRKIDEEELMLTRLREISQKRWKEKEEKRRERAKAVGKMRMVINREQIIQKRGKMPEAEEDEEEEKDEDEQDEEDEEEAQKNAMEEEPEVLPEAEEKEEEEMKESGKFVPTRDKPSRKRVRSWRELQTKRDEGQTPRKGLLLKRKKPPQQKVPIFGRAAIDNVEDSEEDADGNEENEEEVPVPTAELIALRKRPGYNRKAITNRNDFRFRQILDSGDYLLEQHEFAAALQKYEQVLARDAESPRALFGRARLQQLKAEYADPGQKPGQENELLEKAMADYEKVLDNEETPDELFRIAAQHFVECARFRGGNQHKVLQIQRALVDRFPADLEAQCQFGAIWLGLNRPEEAATIFKNVLEAEPGHPLAQAFLGYILKVHNGELERGVQLLRKAIRSGRAEVIGDPKFYFHLGDGLTRLGRTHEAYAVYGDAVGHGLFPSVFQRSMHNLKGLTARPWWPMDQLECAKQLRQLERHWTAIKEEAVQIWTKRRNLFVAESGGSHLLVNPSADVQWALVLRGNSYGPHLREEICDRWMPSTCELLRPFTASICAREKIKLSVLQSGLNTWPMCGPTNYVLEAHLGLVAPSEARLRVGQEIKGWRQGKLFVFDTSFEREITFEGAPANALRIALVLELWHPEVPQTLRRAVEMDKNDDKDGH